jgi:hypothetical protein
VMITICPCDTAHQMGGYHKWEVGGCLRRLNSNWRLLGDFGNWCCWCCRRCRCSK